MSWFLPRSRERDDKARHTERNGRHRQHHSGKSNSRGPSSSGNRDLHSHRRRREEELGSASSRPRIGGIVDEERNPSNGEIVVEKRSSMEDNDRGPGNFFIEVRSDPDEDRKLYHNYKQEMKRYIRDAKDEKLSTLKNMENRLSHMEGLDPSQDNFSTDFKMLLGHYQNGIREKIKDLKRVNPRDNAAIERLEGKRKSVSKAKSEALSGISQVYRV